LSPLTLPLANKLSYLGTIVTPHNVYLAVLGDTGLFGLLAYLSAMLYLTLVRPLSKPGRYTLLSAAVGFLILAHGLVETHEVFIPGLAWLLLVFGHAVERQQPLHTATPLAEPTHRQPSARVADTARNIS
jgi:O-antigen ligase